MSRFLNRTRKGVGLVVGAVTAGALIAGASTAVALPPSAATKPAHAQSFQEAANKALVVHVYDQLFNHGNLSVIDKYIRPDYIQHSPQAADGRQPLRDFVARYDAAYPKHHTTIHRVIADGDLVVLHSNAVAVPGTRGTARADIFRVENGRIAEHWAVRQQVPETTASGNDMFSTLSSPRLPWPDRRVPTEVSRQAVTNLYTGIANRDLTAFDRYIADPYYQHNPWVPNGTEAVKNFFAGRWAANPDATTTVKRIIAENDYVAVYTHSKDSADDRGMAILDIYRVREGKIVEHWDMIEAVPATSANGNTMF
ncbi:ester cyclase [Streptomyces sp. ME02-8801-2C]|uniref:nuclear transport factor 2 family protein n=1 Tax=Streptomyces sp. ME02-8801-2C TaxID=3028680 RepID=UPI0029B2C8A5|nr:nuclear transport factor 2 family protein [Streptomyces sp. ME02-8801-2C]MDX3453821.1 ester cyclase [Streptomyces sp. ME02-8801-2C]